MNLVEFTSKGKKAYVNPFFVTGIMPCEEGTLLQGAIKGGTDIFVVNEKHMAVDQDIKTVKARLEYEPE